MRYLRERREINTEFEWVKTGSGEQITAIIFQYMKEESHHLSSIETILLSNLESSLHNFIPEGQFQ
ncbi:hypothetical protein AID08_15855 [Salmonella enterica subsp. enterica serovar Minnesota]|nr:hypothetical protein [Salmonella enterica subsp. enterica serovar Minnesota]EBZ3812943.1 hypothetical protein [Salmonella enterica subsp. enterica serovar Minnesota]